MYGSIREVEDMAVRNQQGSDPEVEAEANPVNDDAVAVRTGVNILIILGLLIAIMFLFTAVL